MVDIEMAKKEFFKYVSNYDEKNQNINRKKYHSIRVMELSTDIAKSLDLDEEEVEIVTLIGLLHDIARFEQYKRYKTFSDKNIDHGDLGVEILQKNNFIRKFISTNKYDQMIMKAIKNHNKFQIESGLNEKEILYSKIIRDADKLDILYEAIEMFWISKEEKYEIENSKVSEDYYNNIIENKLLVRDLKKRPLVDNVVFVVALILDINFKYSFEYILKENFVDNILDRFNYTDFTKKQINEIKNAILNYIKNKIVYYN